MAADQTQVTSGVRTLPMAPLGAPNVWPRFRFQLRETPVSFADDLSVEDREGGFASAGVPPLPYLMQDNYTRRRQPGQLPTVTVENPALRAVFYPSLGGRMISLFDKRQRRELLFDNRVFQPANLAIRNAWFSGGVEWNGPLYGHSLLTCSPVFAGRIDSPRGPILRLYEFDRALETSWQVDVLLPADDDRLWIHVKAINPNPHDVRFYWWTNIAVPLTRDTRVLAAADYALGHDAKGVSRLPFPDFEGFDGSYPRHYSHAMSVFFRKPGQSTPWSACIDGDGRGLTHVSTATLSGRKFFTWGLGRGGKRWMDFLSADGQGDYIEIQGGVTPTQLQTRPLNAGQSLEWTECISSFAMDAHAAQDPNYAAACTAARAVVDRRVPDAALQDMHAFLTIQADAPVRGILQRGAGWGALYQRRTGRRISPGLTFETPLAEEERPWAELLSVGAFSAESLSSSPRSFNTSPAWTKVLHDSAQAHGPTWLHHLHLGVADLEAGRFAVARERFQSSLALKRNAPAYRNLALLCQRDDDLAAAHAAYESAWSLCPGDQNLAIEYCGFLVQHKRTAALAAFVNALPGQLAAHERITLLQAEVAIGEGDTAGARRLLEREYCTIREGELSLSELWFASYVKEAQQRKGRGLTEAEQQQIKDRFPPPRAIDFRMR